MVELSLFLHFAIVYISHSYSNRLYVFNMIYWKLYCMFNCEMCEGMFWFFQNLVKFYLVSILLVMGFDKIHVWFIILLSCMSLWEVMIYILSTDFSQTVFNIYIHWNFALNLISTFFNKIKCFTVFGIIIINWTLCKLKILVRQSEMFINSSLLV